MRQIKPSDDGVDEAFFGEVAVTLIGTILVHLRCVLAVVNLNKGLSVKINSQMSVKNCTFFVTSLEIGFITCCLFLPLNC